MGGGDTPKPTPIPLPPQLPNINAEGYSRFAATRRMAGLQGTIATGGQGLTSPAYTTRTGKSLIGE